MSKINNKQVYLNLETISTCPWHELKAQLSFQTFRGLANLLFFSFPGAVTVPTEHSLKFHSVLESGLAPQLTRVGQTACINEDRTLMVARPFDLQLEATEALWSMGLVRNF